MQNLLEVKNLCKNFREFALRDISFALEKGYIMGFIGPNGAGKSTTIKLIMNLARKDSGEIRVFGMDNMKEEVRIKERIGFVYDESHFYEELTANEMKNIIASFYRQWDDKAFYDFAKRFGISLHKKIKTFSKGEKMKFSLALALSHNAELIIMDEPTSGLDPVFRNEILDILRDLIQDENKSILFSTHITTDLDKVADFITFINKGELVITGPKDDIVESYVIAKGGLELLNEEFRKEFIGIRETSFNFEGLIKKSSKLNHLHSGSLVMERPSLEDIMLYSVRGYIHA